MFQALLLEKAESGFSCRLTELEESRLPEADVLVRPEYSTLNYKDALALTNRSPAAITPESTICSDIRHWTPRRIDSGSIRDLRPVSKITSKDAPPPITTAPPANRLILSGRCCPSMAEMMPYFPP